jgi:cardiolipin synthase
MQVMFWEHLRYYWGDFVEWLPALMALFNLVLATTALAFVLMTKPDSTSAVAWCLLIILVPFVGSIVFYFFGYQHVNRPLERKRRHKLLYQAPPEADQPAPGSTPPGLPAGKETEIGCLNPLGEELARLAKRFGAHRLKTGNQVDFYHEGLPAFDAMLEAIRDARHHIHLESFIFQPDATGQLFLDLLARKAKEGVQVRLLYDAMGSIRLHRWTLAPLRAAGGRCSVFLPLNPFRRRIQVNMRNHRKILVVDGQVGFVGGLNIGDEYLGKVPRFGFWRDTHLRLRGPAVADLQRVFIEDWDFAALERVVDPADPEAAQRFFPTPAAGGPYPLQIIDSGPDREMKGIREIYFAAVLKARQRVWIASPYFVPDAGLRDALLLAGYLGVDVRFLGQFHPDKWIPLYAARYYWGQVLAAGVKVYQYTGGMLHSKLVLVDDDWASVGTANLDNRSLYLNFEVNCLLYSRQAVAELEAAYLRDLSRAIRLDRAVYGRRPFAGRLLENACRLLSPVL